MFEAGVMEFPYVEQLPKREKSRLKKLWEHVAEIRAITEEKGLLLPVKLTASLLDISQQRIDQLCQAGSLERVNINGHPFVTETSIIEWGSSERKAGRPPNLPTTMKESWKRTKAGQKKS